MQDVALLESWRAGDPEAGERLFALYFDEIYGFFARKIGDDVADLVQLTFLKCIESRDGFRGESSVRTYLYAIARNELYQYFRVRERDSRLCFSVSSLRDLGDSPSTRLAKRSEAARLVQALEQLPLELQLVVELRYWHGMTGPDLAVVLDVPEGTVRSRLRRAIEQLRRTVEQLGREPMDLWESEATFEAWARSRCPYSVSSNS